MYESWIVIEDVGVEPDHCFRWPKLGVAHITNEFDFESPNLGSTTLWHDTICGIGVADRSIIIRAECAVQYFNDGGPNPFPPSTGTMGYLDVLSLYTGEFVPIQLCCNNITKAEFETYLVFDTLPELKFSPVGD